MQCIWCFWIQGWWWQSGLRGVNAHNGRRVCCHPAVDFNGLRMCAVCCCYCRLELKAGELPASLELDERSHPSLTDDLLHLVHGRTLLGVVQLPHTVRLEGEHTAAPLAVGGNVSAWACLARQCQQGLAQRARQCGNGFAVVIHAWSMSVACHRMCVCHNQ
jgi:hypothetical protein